MKAGVGSVRGRLPEVEEEVAAEPAVLPEAVARPQER